MLPKPTAEAINQQAAEWVARLDARTPTSEDQSDLELWLNSDTRCLGAYARARALFLSPQLDKTIRMSRPMPIAPLSRRGFMAAMAASIAAAAFFVLRRHPSVPPLTYESLLGEVRRIPLEDGSYVTLNTGSRISVDYRDNVRLIRLLRGEAFFEVAKAANRPFIVMGRMVQVRTVGTSYSVRLIKPGAMKVQVATGKVALESPPSRLAQSLMRWANVWPDIRADEKSRVYVSANQEAMIRTANDEADSGEVTIDISALAVDAVAQALMWRAGQLSFTGETLAEAVAEFARYSAQKIVIADKGLAKKHVSGLFAATDPAGFARAIAVSLNAKISEKNNTIILS